MAENIVLSVQLQGADVALAQLTQLDSVVTRLKANRNVKISVNARSLATAATNAQTLNTNLSQVTQNAKTMGNTGAQGVQKTGAAIQKASRNAESFNTGMGNVVLTMAKFRLASAAINLVATGFKEAFAEMKRVDSEMVTIRKVTGFTADEMERLSQNAYSLASKYGRTASEVMAGESVFARAGYTDQIEQLAEMNLLLQNVGDISADDAAKFLIATDAAYKFGGSQENLMAVIDGLNEITNKHATDMQKMTEGMTVAGSVFAESGESIETFAALLGAATAKTQRSGSEMARGLRTILMNLRQIRGETEDGELINGESIAAASKALKDYANISTMENGKLRKASDVLDDLAKKWGTLTETQKAAVAEAVAGKRQANVLMALMGDWATYQQMQNDFASGAGSALAENEIYLDSWEAKTNQLKASWTELVASIADSSLIKGALDIINAGLQSANDIVRGDRDLAAVEERDNAAYRSTFDLTGSLRSATRSFEKDFDAEAFTKSIEGAVAAGQEFYNTLQQMKQGGTEWTYQEENFAQAFEALQNGLENGTSAFDLYGYAVAAAMLAAGSSAEESAEGANTKLDDLASKIEALPSEKKVNIILSVTGSGGLSGALADITGKLSGAFSGDHFASGTSRAPGGPALVNENGPEMISANGLAWIAGGGRPTVTMLPRGATVLTAQETRRATGGRNLSGIPAYAGGTSNRQEYADQWSEWTIADGARPGQAVFTPSTTSRSTTTRITADDLTGKNSTTISGNTKAEYTPKYCPVCGTPNPKQADRCVACGYNFAAAEAKERNKSNGGEPWIGEAGPTPPDFKALEDELSKRLKNLDAQAELAENEEDFVKAMMVYGDAQDAIADLLEQYRANGYADDSDEVLRLANMGYDYAHKQLNDYDELQSRLIDALNALTEETEKANALAERQEAVDKAREALRNAESQRTVRIFNPVTGQWEWVANAADVEKARENLKSAEDALQREQIDQTIDAIKNAKPEDLAGMTLTPAVLDKLFNGTPEQQSAFLNALNAATGGADYLGSAEGQTAWNQGNSIGTQYNLNGITLTEAQAAGMSIKELLDMLRGLKVMT